MTEQPEIQGHVVVDFLCTRIYMVIGDK